MRAVSRRKGKPAFANPGGIDRRRQIELFHGSNLACLGLECTSNRGAAVEKRLKRAQME